MPAARLTARCETRCTPEEKTAWTAYARERGVGLSTFARICLNNTTGFTDPPDLTIFSDDDLAAYTTLTSSEQVQRRHLRRRRRPRRGTGLAVLIGGLLAADTALQALEMFVLQ